MKPRPVSNPPNPWVQRATGGYEVEWLGESPQATVDYYEEEARSILEGRDAGGDAGGDGTYRHGWPVFVFWRPPRGAGHDDDHRKLRRLDGYHNLFSWSAMRFCRRPDDHELHKLCPVCDAAAVGPDSPRTPPPAMGRSSCPHRTERLQVSNR